MRYLSSLLALAIITLGPSNAAAHPNPTVAVGIFCGERVLACDLTSQAALKLADERGQGLAEFPAGTVLRASLKGDRVELSSSQPPGSGCGASYLLSSPAPIQVSRQGQGPRSYRGQIRVYAASGRLVLVNQVALEDYLRGVLPSEILASFAPEALRAQAIAARTYTLATTGRHSAQGYDLCDGSHCQVYRGVSGEDPRTDAALQATAGLIVTYQGRPIHAVYHDCCGGRTAGNETAWSGSQPLPYLRPVEDRDGGSALCAGSPQAVWTRQLPQAQLASALARFGVTPPISAIEVNERDENGRPKQYCVRGAGGQVIMLAGPLRAAVNSALGWNALPRADFTAAPNGDSIVFAGRGSGHGVGLCQWGANARAKAGHTAAEILAHYYSGVKIEPISGELAAHLDHQPTG
jgi:stage II sporulation protein D